MTTNQLEIKLKRIILDMEELAAERYLDSDSKDDLERMIIDLKRINVYSTDL